jgi:DNA-binding LacI/PurR family transcriptional regulator
MVMRGTPGASPANREKVLRIAREVGYVPDSRARGLRRGRSRLLGVMFGVDHPFHADLVKGIYSAAEEAGFDVVLSGVTDDRGEDRAVQTLLGDRCEALILLAPRSSRSWLAEVASRLPVVVVARGVEHPDIGVVRTAEAKGIGLAVDHLVELGHAHIVHIDGGDATAADQRRRGYRSAMKRHGLSEMIIHGGLTERNGAQAMAEILAFQDLPTAVLAYNDRCATGVLETLHRAGVKVPDQISVVGFDDTHVAGFNHIDLTTVRQDAPIMAQLAVQRVINQVELDQGHGGGLDIIPPALVVRGTSGKAR